MRNRPRRANKRDANEAEIIKALEAVGCRVLQEDNFDLLVRLGPPGSKVHMLEVKNPEGRDLVSDSQKKMLLDGWPLVIVRSPEEALRAVGLF